MVFINLQNCSTLLLMLWRAAALPVQLPAVHCEVDSP